MAFKNILVAYDGSDQSQKALQKAMDLVKGSEGKIVLVHAYQFYALPSTTSVAGYSVYISEEEYQNLNRAARAEAEHIVEEAKGELSKHNIEFVVAIGEGNAASYINETAQAQKCDLVVMGSHGYGPFKEMMLGSVSHRIVQISQIPVLIVK